MKYNPQLFELIYSFIILLKILFILTLPVITRRRVTVLGVCQAWFVGLSVRGFLGPSAGLWIRLYRQMVQFALNKTKMCKFRGSVYLICLLFQFLLYLMFILFYITHFTSSVC